MEDEIDDAEPIKIPRDITLRSQFGSMDYVSQERKEEIIEWMFEFYPDVDYVIMGDEIIIKDRDCRMHFKMVWG